MKETINITPEPNYRPFEKLLRGKIEFTSFFDPIKLIFSTGPGMDLRDFIFPTFDKLRSRSVSMNCKIDLFELKKDPSSIYKLDYENDEEGICIWIVSEKASSNIEAYFSSTLQTLNGRNIVVEIGNEYESIKVYPDENENVMGLYYTDCNMCDIPEDKVKSICKPGSEETCIFLTVSGKGFQCSKFDSYFSRLLLSRHIGGTLNAKRIGDCKILGRKENSNPNNK
jgi:hypothetical protein